MLRRMLAIHLRVSVIAVPTALFGSPTDVAKAQLECNSSCLGGSAYSSQPPPKAKSAGVLPVKAFLSFKQINVAAAKTKITQLNDEIKSADVSSQHLHPIQKS